MFRVHRAFRVKEDHRVFKVLPVHRVFRANKAPPVQKEKKEIRERQEQQVQ